MPDIPSEEPKHQCVKCGLWGHDVQEFHSRPSGSPIWLCKPHRETLEEAVKGANTKTLYLRIVIDFLITGG